MRPHLLAIVLSIVFLISCHKKNAPLLMELDADWSFNELGDTSWMPAEVPGSLHTDLLRNGLIEDPFYRLNEYDCQWVDKKDWAYKTHFQLSEDWMKNQHIELVFHGLDTHAEIHLNGSKLGSTDNMFIKYEMDCKELLKTGKNELVLTFRSPINYGIDQRDKLGYLLPGAENDQSQLGGVGDIKTCVFSRKAQYHFGWDWGPRLVSSGIWRKVQLRAWNDVRINDMNYVLNKLEKDKASLDIGLEIETVQSANYQFTVFVDDLKIMEFEKELDLGLNTISFPAQIDDPELWYPNGLGEQKLYALKIQLEKDGMIVDTKRLNMGLRTIEVVMEEDSIGHGFVFEVNGIPVFMKGANYIPQDVFLSRVGNEQYEEMILNAKEANFNMLRIWGGGIYENEIFYDLCDKHGILVWQDFMFACAMYPGNEEFLENVRKEAIHNVKRLRNHTSIALWCGDNEILSAWNRWGWKENVLENQGTDVVDTVWHAYDTLFHEILPEIVHKYDPQKLYWTSSPSAGFGQLEDWKSGDVHYWGVWWGKEPFSNYKTKIGRFMSEYGFQSFPDFNSVRKYTEEEDHDIYSEVMRSHQRSSIGNVTIDEYLKRDYNTPGDFPMFLYINQVLQAEGIKMAIEAHRRNMPFCMGSLYWQLNDCWPVASWSGIDYYGNWKAMHYFVKKAFEPVLVSPELTEQDILKVFAISDRLEDQNAELSLKLIDLSGNTVWAKKMLVNIKSNASTLLFEIELDKILQDEDRQKLMFVTELFAENKTLLSDNHIFLSPVKNLVLPVPGLDFEVKKSDGGFIVHVKTQNLAKNVYLFADGLEGHFSDNYFDLLPGRQTSIHYKSDDKIEMTVFKDKLKIFTVLDSYEK